MPEVVVALGPQALRFILGNRGEFSFHGPIVFCCTSRSRLATLNATGAVTGIISEFDVTKTLALAEHLQPRAREVAVIAGATEFDREFDQHCAQPARTLCATIQDTLSLRAPV